MTPLAARHPHLWLVCDGIGFFNQNPDPFLSIHSNLLSDAFSCQIESCPSITSHDIHLILFPAVYLHSLFSHLNVQDPDRQFFPIKIYLAHAWYNDIRYLFRMTSFDAKQIRAERSRVAGEWRPGTRCGLLVLRVVLLGEVFKVVSPWVLALDYWMMVNRFKSQHQKELFFGGRGLFEKRVPPKSLSLWSFCWFNGCFWGIPRFETRRYR